MIIREREREMWERERGRFERSTGGPGSPGGPDVPRSPVGPLGPDGPGSPCIPGSPWKQQFKYYRLLITVDQQFHDFYLRWVFFILKLIPN